MTENFSVACVRATSVEMQGTEVQIRTSASKRPIKRLLKPEPGETSKRKENSGGRGNMFNARINYIYGTV